MTENSYTYELYRFDSKGLKGYVDMSVREDMIHIDDFTHGSSTKEFFGSSSHGIEMFIDRENAIKVLEAYGMRVGKFPAEKLALYLAERFTGNDSAFSAIREVVKEAGVKPMIWMDRD